MSGPEAARDSFEHFVAAKSPALLRTAYLLTSDHHDAEDLVQTALLRVVPHWSRIQADPERYVRTVIAHESVSRWRRRRWRESSTATLPESTASDDSVQTEVRVDVLRALDTLPPRQRAVIVLRYYDDLTEGQTAAALGISVGTVKSQARDALARLRTLGLGTTQEATPATT